MLENLKKELLQLQGNQMPNEGNNIGEVHK